MISSFLSSLIVVTCLSHVLCFTHFNKKFNNNNVKLRMAVESVTDWPELEKCLYKEYTSFFQTLSEKYYTNDVAFIDPITKFTGIDKYKSNIDLIGGRNTLGNL